MLNQCPPLRLPPRRIISPLLLLVLIVLAGCANRLEHAGLLHTAQLQLTYDAQRDRITSFGPAGGPNLLGVRDLQSPPAADGSYTFFGGMYSWISPQGAWVDASGQLRDWPPDPAMDRGPAVIVNQDAGRVVARGPVTRSGLVEQKWFELAPGRYAAIIDQRLHNPTGGNVVGGVWVNTAVKPGAIIAVRDRSSDHFRISGGDAANTLWARATTSRDGWLLIHTDGVDWSDLGTDSFKFFAQGPTAIAIWTDGYWLLRQGLTDDSDGSLAKHGEAPVEVYVNYGLQLFEAELLGPITAIPPGGTTQHVERWLVAPAAEPDPTVLDDLPNH